MESIEQEDQQTRCEDEVMVCHEAGALQIDESNKSFSQVDDRWHIPASWPMPSPNAPKHNFGVISF